MRGTTVSERPGLDAAKRFVTVGDKSKFDNLGQLSMWGSVYIESNGTGFPMEFIGDMHDSTLGGNLTTIGQTLGEQDTSHAASVPVARPVRGIN